MSKNIRDSYNEFHRKLSSERQETIASNKNSLLDEPPVENDKWWLYEENTEHETWLTEVYKPMVTKEGFDLIVQSLTKGIASVSTKTRINKLGRRLSVQRDKRNLHNRRASNFLLGMNKPENINRIVHINSQRKRSISTRRISELPNLRGFRQNRSDLSDNLKLVHTGVEWSKRDLMCEKKAA